MNVAAEEDLTVTPFREWWTPWQVFVLALLCFLAALQFGQNFSRLSPYDEDMHLGYVLAITDFELPPRGTIYPDEVFEEWACRGFHDVSQTTAVPPCGLAQYEPNQFPGLGQQRSSSPPLYYAIIGAVSAIPRHFVGDGPLGVMRLSGSLFLFAAIVGSLEAARLLGSKKSWAFALLLSIPAASRLVMLQTATLTNDAAVFASGALVLAAALRYTTGANRAWLPIGMALFAGLSKETAAFPVLAVATFVALDSDAQVRPLERWRTAAVMAGIGFAVPAAWKQMVTYRTPDDWVSTIGTGNAVKVEGAPWDEIFIDPFGFLPPLQPRSIPASTGLDLVMGHQWNVAVGIVMLLATGIAMISQHQRIRAIAWGLVIGTIASSVFLQAFLALSSRGTFFRGLSPRYGMGFIPIAMVLVVIAVQRTSALRALGIIVIAGSSAMAIQSFTNFS